MPEFRFRRRKNKGPDQTPDKQDNHAGPSATRTNDPPAGPPLAQQGAGSLSPRNDNSAAALTQKQPVGSEVLQPAGSEALQPVGSEVQQQSTVGSAASLTPRKMSSTAASPNSSFINTSNTSEVPTIKATIKRRISSKAECLFLHYRSDTRRCPIPSPINLLTIKNLFVNMFRLSQSLLSDSSCVILIEDEANGEWKEVDTINLVNNGCTLRLVVKGDNSHTSDSDTEDSQQRRSSSDGTPQIEHTSSNSQTTPPMDHTSCTLGATSAVACPETTPSVEASPPPMDQTQEDYLSQNSKHVESGDPSNSEEELGRGHRSAQYSREGSHSPQYSREDSQQGHNSHNGHQMNSEGVTENESGDEVHVHGQRSGDERYSPALRSGNQPERVLMSSEHEGVDSTSGVDEHQGVGSTLGVDEHQVEKMSDQPEANTTVHSTPMSTLTDETFSNSHVTSKALSLQKAVSALKEDLHGVRKDHLTKMSSFLNCMQMAGDQIIAAVKTMKALGPHQDGISEFRKERLCLQTEEELYIGRSEGIFKELSVLQSSIEEMKSDVVERRCKVFLEEVGGFIRSVESTQRGLLGLHECYKPLEQRLKYVMEQELQVIVKEESFIHEEGPKIIEATEKCSALLSVLHTLEKFAAVQSRRALSIPTFTFSGEPDRQLLLQNIEAVLPDHTHRMQSLEQANTIQQKRREINSPKMAVQHFEHLLQRQMDCLTCTNMVAQLENRRDSKLREMYLQEKVGRQVKRSKDTLGGLGQDVEAARLKGDGQRMGSVGHAEIAVQQGRESDSWDGGSASSNKVEVPKVTSVKELARQIEDSEKRELDKQGEVSKTNRDAGLLSKRAEEKELARQRELVRQEEEKELARQTEERELARQAEERELARPAEERELARQAEERELARQTEERELARQEEERRAFQEREAQKAMALQTFEREKARQAQERELARAVREREREERERREVEQRLLREERQKTEQRRRKEKESQQMVLENARRQSTEQQGSVEEGSLQPVILRMHRAKSGDVYVPDSSAGQSNNEQSSALLVPRNRKSIGYSGEFDGEGDGAVQSWDEFMLQEYEHSMSEDKVGKQSKHPSESSKASVSRPSSAGRSMLVGGEVSYDHLPVRDLPQLIRTDSYPSGAKPGKPGESGDKHEVTRSSDRHSDMEAPSLQVSRKSSSDRSSSSSSQGHVSRGRSSQGQPSSRGGQGTSEGPPLQQAMSTLARHQPHLLSNAVPSKLRKSTPELRSLATSGDPSNTTTQSSPAPVFHHTYTQILLSSQPKSQNKGTTKPAAVDSTNGSGQKSSQKNVQTPTIPSLTSSKPSSSSIANTTTSTTNASVNGGMTAAKTNGRDTVNGRESRDIVSGANGRDIVNGANGWDIVNGANGRDLGTAPSKGSSSGTYVNTSGTRTHGRDHFTPPTAKPNPFVPRPVIEVGMFTAEVMEAMRAKQSILTGEEVPPPLTSYPRNAPYVKMGSTAIVKRHTMHNTESPKVMLSQTLPAPRRGSQPQVAGNSTQPVKQKAPPTTLLSSLV